MNDIVEKLIGTALSHHSEWSSAAKEFDEGLTEINELLRRPISGEQLMNLMEFFEACDETLTNVKIRLCSFPSQRNNNLFDQFLKIKYTQKALSLSVLSDGILVLKDLDSAIKAYVESIFKELNESTHLEREHKAICLRRDLRRLYAVLEFSDLNGPFMGVDWTEVEVKEDYIDNFAGISFLEENRSRYLNNPEYVDFWYARSVIDRLINAAKIRLSFLDRLKVFNPKP